MMPCSRPVAPGAFVRPGSNDAAAAADPALAATFEAMCVLHYGRPRAYLGNSGIDVEVRVFLNLNGEAELDVGLELRRAAQVLVMRAVSSWAAQPMPGD